MGDSEEKGEIKLKEDPNLADDIEEEHECVYDDDGFCVTCQSVYEPPDFSGASEGDR